VVRKAFVHGIDLILTVLRSPTRIDLDDVGNKAGGNILDYVNMCMFGLVCDKRGRFRVLRSY
jgi:hypothetical protein